MNPALTSSKRFLVNQADLDEMGKYLGEWEYLFEFLLVEGVSTKTLETDYIDAGMPSNGVAMTGNALTMLNALSYGVIAFIIIAISIILIMIALLCLSYIIRATMADEHVTIGEMIAIGFPGKEIRKLYQMKYLTLAIAAGVTGYLFAIPLGDYFSSSVVMYCGQGNDRWMAWVFPFVGIVLITLNVILRCRRIIQRNLNSSAVELIRGEEMKKKEGHYSLPLAGLKYRNLTVALGELRCKWKEYVVVFLIFTASSFMILLPMNMMNTIENPSFMTYMGVGESDIRIDIQHKETLAEQKAAVQDFLENDPQITKYAIYQIGHVQFQNADGDWEYLRVGSGDESVFPLAYLEGRSPDDSQEIALSYLVATQSGKKAGDTLTTMYQGDHLLLTISGIYQDITYGGKTAKAAIDFDEADIEVFIVYVDVSADVMIADKTEELRRILTDSKVTPINEFVSQTLGGIMDNMNLVKRAAIILSLLLIILITVMLLQLITVREQGAIAIKRAIGFTIRDIRIQLGIRTMIIQVIAILVGTALSNTLGERIFGLMLSSMGASRIDMLVEPFAAYLAYPAVQLVTVLITVVAGTKVVRTCHIRNQIME
jgi:putative ABC transport system permease protein